MFRDEAVGESRELDNFLSEVVSLSVLEIKCWCSISADQAASSKARETKLLLKYTLSYCLLPPPGVYCAI